MQLQALNTRINKPCLCEERQKSGRRWRIRGGGGDWVKEKKWVRRENEKERLRRGKMWPTWRSSLFTKAKSLTHSPPLHLSNLLLLCLLFPQLSSHFLSLNLPSSILLYISLHLLSLPSSFLTLCPPFKVGLTLGVLNLQPRLRLPLCALAVNLSEKWRRWHITGMINSRWAVIL